MNYRDSMSTLNEEGKRKWIFAKKTKGAYTKYRTLVSIILLSFFFMAPFIKINGEQLILLNIFERKFIFFGNIFRPQDIYILVVIIIASIVFITLFTIVYGRIFCGWICPQTIFMEMVFRKIEHLIEGDRREQIKLSNQPWSTNKIIKKSIKLIVFYLISLLIVMFFLIYILGREEVFLFKLKMMPFWFIFSMIFCYVFYWFREQSCIAICPYGRLQSVLLDKKSIVVAYDHKRGEPRGKLNSKEDLGDCIDCHNCVDVCPTGIDIRNGTQMECINCTACIDACDEVMKKVNRPLGLIKYASEENISKGNKFKFTYRIMGYTFVLSILVSFIFYLLFSRSEIDTTILRFSGQMYQEEDNGKIISNVYNYEFVNKTFDTITITPKLLNIEGKVVMLQEGRIQILPEQIKQGTLFIKIPLSNIEKRKQKVKIGLYNNKKIMDIYYTNFMAPVF